MKRSTPQDEADDLANFRIIEGCLIFNEVTGHFFRANESAVFVFEHLREGRTVPEIVELLCDYFGLDRHVAERDLNHFLDDLGVVR